MKRRDWIIISLLFLLIFAVQSWAVYHFFTAPYTGGNDFYSRWAGGRALLVERRDPYSLEVTAEIQRVKNIDPALTGKGSFAYPLNVLFFFLPLVYLPYTWALAIWMVLLFWLVVATAVLLTHLFHWKTTLLGAVFLIFATILLYPVTRSILLGQFTLHVTLFIVAALLLLQHGHDGWAGAVLAATSVKPQMVVIIGPWLVFWAIWQKRWRFIGGLLVAGLAMFLGAMLLFPRWPIAFLQDVQRYAPVAGGKNPLVVLVDQVWTGAGEIVQLILTITLVGIMLWACWQGRHDGGKRFWQATYWTIITSLLVLFQTGTTNQTLLLIPLFDWLAQLYQQRFGRITVPVIILTLLFFPWLLFLRTISGNAESPVLFLPLPSAALVVLLILEARQLFGARGTAVSSTT